MNILRLIMTMVLILVSVACGVLTSSEIMGQENAPMPIDSFQLRDTAGNPISLTELDEKQFVVVCFLGTECPLAKLYATGLNKLANEFASQGIQFIGVNSNRQDSEEELIEYVEKLNIVFPVAKDHRNVVADNFQAQRTPEVFLLDHQLQVLYRGRIDDQYLPGISKTKPGREDLRIAIEESLAGESVSNPSTRTEGCIIGRVKTTITDSPITFSKQVSRILQRHCVECHREGDIGPFSLTDYEEVVGWGDMLVEVIDEGRMPPWHANPDHGEFTNTRFMPDEDKQALRDWVDAGAPFGKPEELPALPPRVEGWKLARQPDAVIAMRGKPFQVRAEGTVDYQYFVVDPGFKEDRWVVAAEVVPGNRSVVHHSIVFVRPPDGAEFEGLGWLSAYVPGQRANNYPPGYARRVPAGSRLVFQQHYTPVGSEQSDITKIGLVFGDEKDVTHKVFTTVAIDQQFEIPAESEHTVHTSVRNLPSQGKLMGVAPHMHYRGKSCRVTTRVGDQEQIMLDVPNYDFNWQHSYNLKHPLDLAEIDEINFDVTFDNTDANPANPDPTQNVYWGDQTWEEMAVAFFQVAIPFANSDETLAAMQQQSDTIDLEFSDREKLAQQKFVDEFIERFDKNQDQFVVRSELPYSMRDWINYWDSDSDRKLSKANVANAIHGYYLRMDEREASAAK